MTREIRHLQIPLESRGQRLDQVLAELCPEFSRARLQKWLKNGQILVNEALWRPRDKVAGGEQVSLDASPEQEVIDRPEALTLDIVHEDAALIVLNKPAGLVVHPAAGNPAGTLLNGLLHQYPELATVPRAGIVHRLDKNTSGLMVVARNLEAQNSLVAQLQARTVTREYYAVVSGTMVAGGTVDAPLGRHPKDRKRMAVVPGGKPAVTHYRVQERFRAHTLVRLNLETGRTHQIRVHMAHIRYPIVGDPVYGGRLRLPGGAGEALMQCLRQFGRQALHAKRLSLVHPGSGVEIAWEVPLPADMEALIGLLREDAAR